MSKQELAAGARSKGSRSREPEARDRMLGEQDPLAFYFADIGHIPTLTHEEEVLLAKEIESTMWEFREALFSIPWTARELVRTWQSLKSQERATGKLSESFGSGSPEVGARLDSRLRKARTLLRKRERLHAGGNPEPAALEALDRRLVRQLLEADLSIRVLGRLRGQLRERRRRVLELQREQSSLASRRRAPRSERGHALRRAQRAELEHRRAEIEAEVGLALRRFLARSDAAEAAFERLTEAKNRFVWHNLKLVVVVAKDFRNLGVSFQDLIQEGNIGLVRAVEKFDWQRGFKFSTYAVWWIRQAMIRAIQNTSRTIRIPSHHYDDLRRYYQARDALEVKLLRRPNAEEIAATMDMPVERAEELERMVGEPVSLESEVGHKDSKKSRKLEDVLEDPSAAPPVESLDQSRLEEVADRFLAQLGEREQRILRWRFGLSGERPHTLEEIGQKLGLSRERARQLEARALGKLRHSGDRALLAAFLENAA